MENDSIYLDVVNHKLQSNLAIFKFVDEDTKMPMYYAPSVEITGYGDTFEEAMEIFQFNMKELFNHIIRLGKSGFEAELAKLGWKTTSIKYRYFKTYSDIKDQLNDLKAENNHIERVPYSYEAA